MMKKILPFILVLTVLVSCKKEPKDYAIVSGTFENLPNSTLRIFGHVDAPETLEIKNGKSFKDTIALTQAGYFTLGAGQNAYALFLAPGDKLNITQDLVNDENPIFTGNAAIKNEYLASKLKTRDTLLGALPELYKKDETSFLSALDKYKEKQLEILSTTKTSDSFKNIEARAIEITYIAGVYNYENYHRYFTGNQSYEATAAITNKLKDLDLDNESDAVYYPGYRDIVMAGVYEKLEASQDESTSFMQQILAISKDYKSARLRDHILSNTLFMFNPGSEDLGALRDRMLAQATHPAIKDDINERYETIKDLASGKPSPDFNYENFKGGFTSLDDFKGKYVYIDVWATWCGPCIAEIPALKQLEEDYAGENIAFVSISTDERKDYTKWRTMITNRELGGTQLITEDDFNSDFIQAYAINAIPRFLLIDTDGNIVNADAPRPSSQSIRTQFDAIKAARK